MAHAIDTTDGQSAFLSAREDAWHQLGTTLPDAFTAEQAMEEGLLGGWNVRKSPLLTLDPETGEALEVPDKVAVIRNNPVRTKQIDVLGTVGPNYTVIQNEQHAELLNTIVDESGAHFETAGSLEGGRKVFITMKLPGHIQVGGVDPIDQYLAAVNSHDGSQAFTLMVTPIRVVCQNTLNLAFRENSHSFKVRHTSGAEKALVTQARQALDFTFKYLDDFQAEAEQLINTTMTQNQFEQIITEAFGAPEDAHATVATRSQRKIDEMAELFSDYFTQEGIRNTAWAGVNALAEWYDHFSPVRGDERDTTRARKAVMDPDFKNRALKMIMAGV